MATLKTDTTQSEAASAQAPEQAREEFDISMDTGAIDLDGENASSATIETFRAITIRALGRASLREWSATLEQVTRELEDAPTSKHSLFTRANVIRVIKQLIARDSVKIVRAQHESKKNAPITAVFALSVQCDLLPTIRDELALTLESVAQTDTEMAFKRLVRRVERQNAEIARLAGIIATYDDFTRAQKIGNIVMQITARYGPLSERMYDLAQRVSAAEVDGKPIIFRVLGCDAPIWLRSVIRFANVCKPVGRQHSDQCSVPFDLPHERTGGNEMSSSPIWLTEWIKLRAHECTCNILIIMPVLREYTKLQSHAGIFELSATSVTGAKPCPTQTIIFGNPFIDTADRTTCDQDITMHRSKFGPWLKQCARVHVAQLGTSASQVASAGPAVGPIYQYSEAIAREYNDAIDAQGELDPTPNHWTYPTHIVSISGNLK